MSIGLHRSHRMNNYEAGFSESEALQENIPDARLRENLQGDATFWASGFDWLQSESTSTSKSSSCYDLEEDSVAESKDSPNRDLQMRMMLEEHDGDSMVATDHSHIRKGGVSEAYSPRFEINAWSKKSHGIHIKEINACEGNRDGEKSQLDTETERDRKQHFGDHRDFHLPDQKLYDLTIDDEKAVAYSTKSILWRTSEDHKQDSTTLSSQEEDFLYKNSDMLAAFEIEEHCNPNKKVQEAIDRHERKEDQYKHPMHDSQIRKNKTSESANLVDNLCRFNTMEPTSAKNIKIMSKFDDTSSWITDNSELLGCGPQHDAISKNLDYLNINNEVSKEHYSGEGKNYPIQSRSMSSSFSCANDKRTHLNPNVSCHRVDRNVLKGRPQEFVEVGIGTKEARMTDIVKVFKEEVHYLKLQNGRLEKLLKEKMADFSKERALWERENLSKMSMFNAFKEEETLRLKKERLRLEKQSKLLAQLPTRKERTEIEELRKQIADITSRYAKKESLQNSTINRLRRTISDQTDQIQSLQGEVKRYERLLLAEWVSDNQKMANLQKTNMTSEFQSTSYKQNSRFSNELQTGRKWNGVSTSMCWTRRQ